MIYLFLLLAMILFIASLKVFDVVPKVTFVFSETRDATSVMKSKELSDEQKEAALQKAAVRMMGSFFSILGRVGLTVVVSFSSVLLGSAIGFYEIGEAVSVASDWPFLIGSTLLMIVALPFCK